MRAAMAVAETKLIDRLPKVRGRLTEGSLLSAVTWFRVGGPADVVFLPADEQDLADFLKALERRKLNVATHVGLRGAIQTGAEFQKAIQSVNPSK